MSEETKKNWGKGMELWGTSEPKPICDYCERLFLQFMNDPTRSDKDTRWVAKIDIDKVESPAGVATLSLCMDHDITSPIPWFYIISDHSYDASTTCEKIDFCPFCGRDLTHLVADAMSDCFMFVAEDRRQQNEDERIALNMFWDSIFDDRQGD